jgi:hypothetical protein
VNVLITHPEQYLSCASEFLELAEDEANDLLDTNVGVKADTAFAIPQKTDGDRYAQLASMRFSAGRLAQANVQDPELEFAHAPLHAEQKPIIGEARVVDAVEVDHACFDQSTELEQMMPIPAVTSQPGGFQAQHRTDATSAQLRDEALEAGARGGPTGGSSKVIINELNVAETMLSGDIHELILAALTLEIFLCLRRCRLANIDDRFAL